MYSFLIIFGVHLFFLTWYSKASFEFGRSFSFSSEAKRSRNTLSIKIDPPISESNSVHCFNWPKLETGLNQEIKDIISNPREAEEINQEIQTLRQNLWSTYQYLQTRGEKQLEFLENVEGMLYEIEKIYIHKQIMKILKDTGKIRSRTFGVACKSFSDTLRRVPRRLITKSKSMDQKPDRNVENAYRSLETIVGRYRLRDRDKKLNSFEKVILQLLEEKENKNNTSDLDQLARLLSKKPDLSKAPGVLGNLARDMIKKYDQPENYMFMYELEPFFEKMEREIEDNQIEVKLAYDVEDEIEAHFWSRLATRTLKQFLKSHGIHKLKDIPEFRSRRFLKQVVDLRRMRDFPIVLPDNLKGAVDQIYTKLSTHQQGDSGLFCDRHKARLYYDSEDHTVPTSTFEKLENVEDVKYESETREGALNDWYDANLKDLTNDHYSSCDFYDGDINNRKYHQEELVDDKIKWGVCSFHTNMEAFKDSRKAEVVRAWINAAERVTEMKDLMQLQDTEHYYDLLELKKLMPRAPWSLDMLFDLLSLAETSVMATHAWKQTCEMVLEQLNLTQELRGSLELEDSELQSDLKKWDINFGLREVLKVDKFLAKRFWYSITPPSDTMETFQEEFLVDPTSQIAELQASFIEERYNKIRSVVDLHPFHITENKKEEKLENEIGEQVARVLSELILEKSALENGVFKLHGFDEILSKKSQAVFEDLRQKGLIVCQRDQNGLMVWTTAASLIHMNSSAPSKPTRKWTSFLKTTESSTRSRVDSSSARFAGNPKSFSTRFFMQSYSSPTRAPEYSRPGRCASTVTPRRFCADSPVSPHLPSCFGSPVYEYPSVYTTSPTQREASDKPSSLENDREDSLAFSKGPTHAV